MNITQRNCFALIFGLIFQLISIGLIIQAFIQFYTEFAVNGKDFTATVIISINTFIIALAMFELGIGISKEYLMEETRYSFYSSMRRTITRFVATVCIALVLESLIMIIKYSQLELAGNLWYPVGILVGSSILLIALGLFLYLTGTSSCSEQDTSRSYEKLHYRSLESGEYNPYSYV
ncbi:MAG: hypothetical protein R3208_03505 [Ketobacteraceae bacterium]|nr:hypothetical protein [Ketobacteraceae bacterium]